MFYIPKKKKRMCLKCGPDVCCVENRKFVVKTDIVGVFSPLEVHMYFSWMLIRFIELKRKMCTRVYIVYMIITSHKTCLYSFVHYRAQRCPSPKLICAFLLYLAQITSECNYLLLTNLFVSHFGSGLVFSG